eukprot:365266-Chlamydomonas_euryale.AAC.7
MQVGSKSPACASGSNRGIMARAGQRPQENRRFCARSDDTPDRPTATPSPCHTTTPAHPPCRTSRTVQTGVWHRCSHRCWRGRRRGAEHQTRDVAASRRRPTPALHQRRARRLQHGPGGRNGTRTGEAEMGLGGCEGTRTGEAEMGPGGRNGTRTGEAE